MRAAGALAALALLLAGCGGGPEPEPLLRVPVGAAPQRGPSDAWVTVVEFSDFQCPACAGAEPQVEALLASRPADVRLLYRHFPLPQHGNAVAAAEAAECARAQEPALAGWFWTMHDALFAGQASWSGASPPAALGLFGGLAGQLPGLDAAAWDACMAGHATRAGITGDFDLGYRQHGIAATPTFVVNGVRVVGAAGLAAQVESALARALASGLPRAQYYDKAVLGL